MNPSSTRQRSPGSTDIVEISRGRKRQKVEIDLTITLCIHCQELDLDKEFERSLKEYQHFGDKTAVSSRHISKASDGTYYYSDAIIVHKFKDRLSKSSDCPLCAFFRSLRVQPEGHKCHKLLAFRSSDSWLFRSDLMEKEGDLFAGCKDTIFMAVVPDIDTLPLCGYGENWLDHDIPATGAIYRLQMDEAREANPPVLLRARELGVEPDLELIQSWLDSCRNMHGNACKSQAVHEPISQYFRVINCTKDPPIVEEQEWGILYAALSYVWGAGPEDLADWPKTVLDAIEVTRRLKLQYLWVDRLCINQSDPAEKEYLISRMTTIFEEADFTIVAAAGSGASHGLPGVRSIPRSPQPKYYLDSGSQLLSILRDPRLEVLNSQYWTRGWTYQEGVLSNRRIVFTESQVYWECRCMAAQESADMMLFHISANEKDETNTHLVMAHFMLTGILKGDVYSGGSNSDRDDLVIARDDDYRPDYGFPVPGAASVRAQLRGLNEHIREFSKRRLTYDTDTLPAFLGIIGLYKQTEPMCLFNGLPMWTGNIAGDVDSARITFALSVSSWYHRSGPEHYMFVSNRCQRKNHLPSWTWAGWTGTVTWRAPPNIEHCAYMHDLIHAESLRLLWAPDIYLCHSERPGSIRLRDTHSSAQLTSQAATLIEIKSPYILNSFQRVVDADKEWKWARRAGRPGREEFTAESASWDAKWYRIGRRLSCVAMSVPTTEDEWTAKHISGELVSILMFTGKYLENEHGTARFLTLRRVLSMSDRWERVGTLYLIIPFLERCLDNQDLFRKIPVIRQNQKIVIQ